MKYRDALVEANRRKGKVIWRSTEQAAAGPSINSSYSTSHRQQLHCMKRPWDGIFHRALSVACLCCEWTEMSKTSRDQCNPCVVVNRDREDASSQYRVV